MNSQNHYNIFDKEDQRFIPLGTWITKKMEGKGLSANNLMWEVSDLPEDEKEEKMKGATWRAYISNIRAGREKIPLNKLTRFLSALGCSKTELKHYQSEIMRCYLPPDLRSVIKPYLRGAYRDRMKSEMEFQAQYANFLSSDDYKVFTEINNHNQTIYQHLCNDLDNFGLEKEKLEKIRTKLCVEHAIAIELLKKSLGGRIVDEFIYYIIATEVDPILGKVAHDIFKDRITQIKDYPATVKSHSGYQPTETELFEIYSASDLYLNRETEIPTGVCLDGYSSSTRERIDCFWMNVETDNLDFSKPISEFKFVPHNGLARLTKYYIDNNELIKQSKPNLEEVIESIFQYLDEQPYTNMKTFPELKREFTSINGAGAAVIPERYDNLFKKLCEFFQKEKTKGPRIKSFTRSNSKLEIEKLLPKNPINLNNYKSLKAVAEFLNLTPLAHPLIKRAINFTFEFLTTDRSSKIRHKGDDLELLIEIHAGLGFDPYTVADNIQYYKKDFFHYLPTINFLEESDAEEINFLTYLIQQLDYENGLPRMEDIWDCSP